jgi:hypothetical protein
VDEIKSQDERITHAKPKQKNEETRTSFLTYISPYTSFNPSFGFALTATSRSSYSSLNQVFVRIKSYKYFFMKWYPSFIKWVPDFAHFITTLKIGDETGITGSN